MSVSRWHSVASTALFAVGIALGLCWLISLGNVVLLLVATAGLTGLYVVATRATAGGIRLAARLSLVPVYIGLICTAICYGAVLGWAIPRLVWAICFALFIGWITTAVRRSPPRIPLALSLGLWIAAGAAAWMTEDGRVRCDDFRRVQSNSAIRLVVPSTADLQQCKPGEALRLRYYPRRVWETPDNSRLTFTAQISVLEHGFGHERPVSDPINGSICSASTTGHERPECFSDGKAQTMVESEKLDRLFITDWGPCGPNCESRLYALPRTGSVRPIAELKMPESMGEMYYDPDADIIGLLGDECREMLFVRASDFTRLKKEDSVICPGETRYDAHAHAGLFCFGGGLLSGIDGQAYASVAFDGWPFHMHLLAPSREYPSSWLAAAWGCDWNPHDRRAYVNLPILGSLVTVDYDSGHVLHRHFLGLGYRSLTYDRERNIVYAANFLRGEVVAIDPDTDRELGRWFVGRYVRNLVLSRDHNHLWATSNVGVTEISLASLR